MKIVIVNGSYRKKGATAQILENIYIQLNNYSDVDVQLIHVADLQMNYCVGCGNCYKTGECIYKDDVEKLSLGMEKADGIILGTPTYASNISGQMKVIIERGHFVIEQLLRGKYAVSIATYENYGGKDAVKILNKLFSYSGAKISGSLTIKNEFNSNPMSNIRLKRKVQKIVDRFYHDILEKRKYIFQDIKHMFVFRIGILPFVLKKGVLYEGVIKRWEQ